MEVVGQTYPLWDAKFREGKGRLCCAPDKRVDDSALTAGSWKIA
ncbi:hypothetical protein ACPOL_0967 [Acidisarcina polymorpha]|uniref:Uncharacterized protein n=1 Tax=Acidisarcina polymorpha TaxID=2211140 RepID=A0A2Z5FU00_9BACT|nr:hypothetical protein ACPOL_0967 [Acidisarcina polymorpha]